MKIFPYNASKDGCSGGGKSCPFFNGEWQVCQVADRSIQEGDDVDARNDADDWRNVGLDFAPRWCPLLANAILVAATCR